MAYIARHTQKAPHPSFPQLTKSTALLVSAIMLSLSLPSLANNRTSGERPHLAQARALVAEYRALRRNCAEQTGDARRACFHALHASNSEYRVAKQQLESAAPRDGNSVHLVTF